MDEYKYKVLIDGVVYAENMNIKTATILIRALLEEYYNDHSMTISIIKYSDKTQFKWVGWISRNIERRC